MKTPVRDLDAFLNARILRAATLREAGHWWAVKVRAKRLLQHTHPSQVDACAVRILAVLQGREDAAVAA